MEANEVTDIKKWLRIYNNPASGSDFDKASECLKKVHDKYGTVDINIIKSLIN